MLSHTPMNQNGLGPQHEEPTSRVDDDESPEINSVREEKRRVRFSSIEFLYFPLQLGDNPSVSEGAPLTIGWDAFGRKRTDVEAHEYRRASGSKREARKMSAIDRELLLLRQGYQLHELGEASYKTEKAKRDLRKSIHNRKWDGLVGVVESAKKRVFKSAVVTRRTPNETGMSTRSLSAGSA